MTIDNVIAGELIDPTWGNSVADVLNLFASGAAFAAQVAPQTGVAATTVDITGATVTFTADPNVTYLMLGHIARMQKQATAGTPNLIIADGSNTIKHQAGTTIALGEFASLTVMGFETGLSGIETRKLRILTSGGGTLDIDSATTRSTIIAVIPLHIP